MTLFLLTPPSPPPGAERVITLKMEIPGSMPPLIQEMLENSRGSGGPGGQQGPLQQRKGPTRQLQPQPVTQLSPQQPPCTLPLDGGPPPPPRLGQPEGMTTDSHTVTNQARVVGLGRGPSLGPTSTDFDTLRANVGLNGHSRPPHSQTGHRNGAEPDPIILD